MLGGFRWSEHAVADKASTPSSPNDDKNLPHGFDPRFFHWAAPAALACEGTFSAHTETAASGLEVASFIRRHTLAREMQCFLAT
jgi:hypothetical protein